MEVLINPYKPNRQKV